MSRILSEDTCLNGRSRSTPPVSSFVLAPGVRSWPKPTRSFLRVAWRTMCPSEISRLSELPMSQNLFEMRSMRTGGIRSPAFKVSFGFASPLTIRPSALEDETSRKRDGLVTKSDQYMDSRIKFETLFACHCEEAFVFYLKEAFVVPLSEYLIEGLYPMGPLWVFLGSKPLNSWQDTLRYCRGITWPSDLTWDNSSSFFCIIAWGS